MVEFPSYLPDRVQQTEAEWSWLLDKMAGAESILEIGSCLGHSLRGFALRSVKGAKLRSIDLGFVGPDEISYVTRSFLKDMIGSLKRQGFDAEVLFADSQSRMAIDWARDNGPYDFIYIDGDHSYEGVKADWQNYARMGSLVGFHDINHGHHGVKRLWNEIKEQGHDIEEKVTSHQGTGLVYMEHGSFDRQGAQAHSGQGFRREGP